METSEAKRAGTLVEPFTYSVEEWPAPQSVQTVKQYLNRFNREQIGEDDHQHLAVVLRDAAGQVVGGLWGETYWGWLYIDVLAIQESARGQGWGTRLMQMAEEEAQRRGCHHVHLDTFDFQALPFYKKLGYTVFGTLDHFPGDHKRYFLQKGLGF